MDREGEREGVTSGIKGLNYKGTWVGEGCT